MIEQSGRRKRIRHHTMTGVAIHSGREGNMGSGFGGCAGANIGAAVTYVAALARHQRVVKQTRRRQQIWRYAMTCAAIHSRWSRNVTC